MKKLNPVIGVLSTLQEMASNGENIKALRKDAFTTHIEDTIIDTCIAFDTLEWETGIALHSNPWVIVQQYDSKEEAEKGHSEWVKNVTDNPNIKLKDINLWNLPNL